MTSTSGSIEGKQLNLCRGNIMFCHVDFFCLQEKRKMKREVLSDSNNEATASAIIKITKLCNFYPHSYQFIASFP